MKKNVLLQLRLETTIFEKLRAQAIDAGITISEVCRQKITTPLQLSRIESRLEKIENEISEINKCLSH